MAEASKESDPKIGKQIVEEEINSTEVASTSENDNDEIEDEHADATNTDGAAAESSSKKKKSKRAKLRKALGAAVGGGGGEAEASEGPSSSANAASKLTTSMVEQLLEMNPSLKSEVAGMGKEEAAEAVKKLDVADLLTGMVT